MNTINYFVQLLKNQTFNLNRFVQYQLLIYNKIEKMADYHNKFYFPCCVIDDNQGKSLITNSLCFFKSDAFENKREQLLEDLRLSRKQLGNKVVVGKSLTVVNDEILQFVVHDRSHTQSDEIYAELNRLTIELLQDGYIPDTSWISRKLRKNETFISALSGHSERLALACNLIKKPSPSFIQITNNLRLCGDCHQFMKRVAKLRQCEIIIRDANRIHHFKTDGECSCKDHF